MLGWKIATVALAVVCVGLLGLLWLLRGAIAKPFGSDARLLGTWISDAERTLEGLDPNGLMSDEHRGNWQRVLGKLTISYSATQLTADMGEGAEPESYQVVAVDENSVVIRSEASIDPILLEVGTSRHVHIHFDGPDAYWVASSLGGYIEYFKRTTP